MSNIGTPKSAGQRHLTYCAAVAFALAVAFIVVTTPRPDTAAAGTTNNNAETTIAETAACLQACCFQTCCLQTWPYYEHSCLRDDGQRDGNARTVRVIAMTGQARRHASRQ